MQLFDELLVFNDTKPSTGAINMAIDEALLESSSAPSIRFYPWLRPSLSFGYFGHFSEVAAYREERDLVRRWTGGGIVLHGEDLTYSIILPVRNRAELPDSKLIYREVHRALCEAFADSAIPAQLVESPPETNSSSCFASPVVADVILGGHKIAGAAHRRTKLGLLHQGSIQNVSLRPEFGALFASRLARESSVETIPGKVRQHAGELAREKYGRKDWLERW